MRREDLFTLMEAGAKPENPDRQRAKEILSSTFNPIIDKYRKVLKDDAEANEQETLAAIARGRLEQHLGELAILADVLDDFFSNPSKYKATIREQESYGDVQTFTARFSLKDEPMSRDSERPQTQLNFHLKINGSESAIETIYALGLKGKSPHEVLRKFFRESSGQQIQINTVGIFRDPDTQKIKIQPRAGLLLKWSSGEVDVRSAGLAYVGNTEHSHELGHSIPRNVFAGLQKMVISYTETQRGTPTPQPK